MNAVVLAMALIGLSYVPFSASAAGNYSISGGTPIVTGTTVTVYGTASANPYVGESAAQKVAVDWTGACASASATEIGFDSVTFEGGTGGPDGHNDGSFTDAGWSDWQDFGPGTHSVCVKVYHDTFDDADAATFNATFVVLPPPNTAPVALSGPAVTNQDTPVGITLVATDANSDPLTYIIVNDPSNGDLSGTGPNVTYTPDPGYSGADSFTWKANDGTADSNNATVSITVNSLATLGTVVVTKVVINDNGGTAAVGDFSLLVDGTPVTSGVGASFAAGAHVVAETPNAGYAATITGDCDLSGNVTVAVGGTSNCTITNDDIAPQLKVIKHVVNDDGGTAVAGDFTMNVTATNPSQASFAGSESPGTTITLDAGSYSVDEGASGGYAKSLSADCSGTIAVGETKTCTITNDDLAPLMASLTVVKVVVNDDAGTAVAGDFPLFIDADPVTSGLANPRAAGTYTVSETNQAGYTGTIGGDCATDGTITLTAGETKTCTITNDDDFVSSGGGGGGGGHHHSSSNNDDDDDDDEEVLGASTDGEGEAPGNNTCPLLTNHMREGMANDPAQVTMLQTFLNGEMASGLPLTGFFGPLTTAAVKAFQLKYWEETLKPWAAFGLPEKTPTGFVFKTTLWKINDIKCPDLDVPFPTLP